MSIQRYTRGTVTAAQSEAEAASKRVHTVGSQISGEVKTRIAGLEREAYRRAEGAAREAVAGAMAYGQDFLLGVIRDSPVLKELLASPTPDWVDELKSVGRDVLVVLTGVGVAAQFAGSLATAISGALGAATGITDKVGREWRFQLACWQRLYAAAGDGRRLPFYDRMFRFRRIGGVGFDMSQIHRLALSPSTVQIVSDSLRAVGAEVPDFNPAPTPWESIGYFFGVGRHWGDAIGAYQLQPNGYIALSDRGWVMSAAPEDTAPYPWLGGFQLPNGHVEFPEIPPQWAWQIPDLYVLFWLAPEDVDGGALLAAYEVARAAWLARPGASGYRTTGVALWHDSPDLPPLQGSGIIYQADHPAPVVGRGLVLLPGAWGDLVALDETPLFLDPEWVAGEFFGMRMDIPGVLEVFVGAHETSYLLRPESYEQIVADINNYALGVDWVSRQRAIGVETDPIRMLAISDAKLIRAGDESAIARIAEGKAAIERNDPGSDVTATYLANVAIALAGFPGE